MKIFYSWQSDLPNSKTRGFIQDCIDAAIKHLSDIVFIEADRDTQGEFGSPDIVETVFSKIDECDLFIADVSIVNKYNAIDDNGEKSKAIKLSPNPNVLLELGYAAKALTWERVVCIMNTDYGKVGELPFDLEHRRPLQYSLDGQKKSAVKEYVRNIIVGNVLNAMEEGVRAKGNTANHIVGGISMENGEISNSITPLDLRLTNSFKTKYDELKDACLSLIEKINSNKLPTTVTSDETKEIDAQEQTKEEKLSAMAKTITLFMEEGKPVSINDNDIAWIRQQVKLLFRIDLADDFFSLGDLKIKIGNFLVQSEYIGTTNEKVKYDDLRDLQSKLLKLDVLELFIKTFDDLILLPLAIYNNSTISDEEISISVVVDPETAEVVIPSRELLAEELRGDDEHVGLEGAVYDAGYAKILMMPESGEITYDTDISFDPSDIQKELRKNATDVFGNSTYEPDADDYEDEIIKFIASPMQGRNDTLLFEIESLRANERKWIGPLIALKPKSDTIRLSYSVKSKNSNGLISSDLICKNSNS